MTPAQIVESVLARWKRLRQGPAVSGERIPPVRPVGRMRRIYKDKSRVAGQDYEDKRIGGYYG